MIAYLDCIAGASGDMILAALLDAGADLDLVRSQVGLLDLGPVEIATQVVHRRGVRATLLEVTPPDRPVLRTYADIDRLLGGAGLQPGIERRARGTLRRLAEAEARAHGTAPEQVHFHEVDGVDTIVDVVGAAAALVGLGVDRVVSSPVAAGRGVTETRSGLLPVPGPAVLELLRGAPVYGIPAGAETVTPTGAAILAELCERFGDMPPMTIAAVGYGAGRRDLPIPNVLRVVVGELVGQELEAAEDVVIEATIDDMNPELYEYVTERLAAAGATDAWIVPVIGKRGRPAQVLQVLCPLPLEGAVRDVIVGETSTLGVRSHRVRRWMMERTWVEVEVEGWTVRVKVALRDGAVSNVAPEYADCAQVARSTGLALKEVFRLAQVEAAQRYQGGDGGRGGS